MCGTRPLRPTGGAAPALARAAMCARQCGVVWAPANALVNAHFRRRASAAVTRHWLAIGPRCGDTANDNSCRTPSNLCHWGRGHERGATLHGESHQCDLRAVHPALCPTHTLALSTSATNTTAPATSCDQHNHLLCPNYDSALHHPHLVCHPAGNPRGVLATVAAALAAPIRS